MTAGTWDQFRAHTLCAMLNGLRVFDVSHGHTSAPLAAASGGSGRLDHDLTPRAMRGIRNFTSRRTSCTEMQVPAHPATAF